MELTARTLILINLAAILAVIAVELTACGTVAQTGDADVQQARVVAAPVIDVQEIQATGTCQGSVSAQIVIGGLAIPITFEADTKANAEGEASGEVAVVVAGMISARCAIARGAGGKCGGGVGLRPATP